MNTFKNIEPYKIENAVDFVVHSGNKISSKALIDNDAIEVRFFSAAQGEEIDKEIYHSETLIFCLEGQIKIVYNDTDEAVLNTGQMITLEAGIAYGLIALKTTKYYSILINQ